MTKKMLIDAAHPEETRVVILDKSNTVEEFDFESKSKCQLRGNIYLAKIARIEPSLQAAFVDYGGNRHGFLAFNEIHPDYYQIPASDRDALLEAEAAANRAMNDDDDGPAGDDDADEAEETDDIEEIDDEEEVEELGGVSEFADPGLEASNDVEEQDSENTGTPLYELSAEEAAASILSTGLPYSQSKEVEQDEDTDSEDDADGAESSQAEPAADSGNDSSADKGARSVSDDEEDDPITELRSLRRQKLRDYKIQEVIKKRQIILVQVVKEERGTKGAALTTYLSLAGRYCVLMPNTGRGGGISRKIGNVSDRRRLRKIVDSFEVPQGMGLIIRTAGAKRTKSEIKRDYEHLLRIWENVRKLTLESIAPTLVYEEGSLVKRTIRDLYNKDINEVVVEGDEAYKEAKHFMRMLIPSHAKNVKQYKEPYSMFQAYTIEAQLDATLNPTVPLRSGGYLVINPTEALVSIDVNSGKSTRERSLADTALKTNLEAASEVARQCRLRDLAGLIVIDFIDMEEHRNNRAVERRLKDAMKQDRARIQVGRISSFGLLEMSRQRMRSGVLEGSSQPCPTCHGRAVIRSFASTALRILRGIEEACYKNPDADKITVRAGSDVALYLLNEKRPDLAQIETRYPIRIEVEFGAAISPSEFEIICGETRISSEATTQAQLPQHRERSRGRPPAETASEDRDEDQDEQSGSRSKRRRRRKKPKNNQEAEVAAAASEDETQAEDKPEAEGDEESRGRRRRGRRGGRRRRKPNAEAKQDGETADNGDEQDDNGNAEPALEIAAQTEAETFGAEADDAIEIPINAPRQEDGEGQADFTTSAQPIADASADVSYEAKSAPAWTNGEAHDPQPVIETQSEEEASAETEEDEETTASEPAQADTTPSYAAATEPAADTSSSEEEDDNRPAKRGWWQRK